MNKNKLSRIDRSQRLFIELGTAIRIETHEKNNSLSGKLVGMKVGSYLIVDISAAGSDTISLSDNSPVLVKYINLRDIFNFSSTVLCQLDQPDNLIFLKYPDRVENCNIRNHKRVDCFLPIHAKIGEFYTAGIAVNINAKGCLCTLDHFPSWDNINPCEIELIFSYCDLETLSITGEIKTSQTQGSKITVGVQFNEINPFSQSVLTALVPALRY